MIDSNAAQFARMGFPWFDANPEPEVPVSRASRRIRKNSPNMAKLKPEFREEGRVKRALTAEEERAAKHRQMLHNIRRQMREQSVTWRHSGEPLVEPREIAAERRAKALDLASKRNMDRLEAAQVKKEQDRARLVAAFTGTLVRR